MAKKTNAPRWAGAATVLAIAAALLIFRDGFPLPPFLAGAPIFYLFFYLVFTKGIVKKYIHLLYMPPLALLLALPPYFFMLRTNDPSTWNSYWASFVFGIALNLLVSGKRACPRRMP